MSDKNNNTSQRLTFYRAVIPFYILYDLDLNANHLRMYGQIEQMESNPDPRVKPSFSYSWLAEQLGINRRNCIKMASLLIEKGYIEHREVSQGKYIWNTKKAEITDSDEGGECLPETPPSVSQRHPPSVSQRHPKIPKDKIPKDNISILDFFSVFWGMYPTKKAKAACESKWKSKKLESIGQIIIEKLKDQIERDEYFLKGYAPNPLTYINQQRWEDELKIPNKNDAKKHTKNVHDDESTDWARQGVF